MTYIGPHSYCSHTVPRWHELGQVQLGYLAQFLTHCFSIKVKHWFKWHVFYIFPHLRYIFSGSSESSTCLMHPFPWFKCLSTFNVWSFDSYACFGSCFYHWKQLFCMFQIICGPPMHISRWTLHGLQYSMHRLEITGLTDDEIGGYRLGWVQTSILNTTTVQLTVSLEGLVVQNDQLKC